jgi:hypothetical protein
MLLYVNVKALKAWTVSSLSFGPADCSSWELCQTTVSGQNRYRRGARRTSSSPLLSHVDLPLFTLLFWGHWRLWARLLNFNSTPLESSMDVIAPGCLYAYGLPLRLRPASTPTACLYAYGLPFSSSLTYHRHRHRPFPVQAERLSFSFM